MPFLFCHIAWMENYQGSTKNDTPQGGGAFVSESGRAGETCNFVTADDDYVYGHVETLKGSPPDQVDRQIRIENLGASTDAPLVDGIDVIWTATHPTEGGRRVVGWYRNARVYRERNLFNSLASKRHKKAAITSFRIRARAEHVFRIPLSERTIELGRGSGWMGKTNWWFPDPSKTEIKALLSRVKRFMDRNVVSNLSEPSRNPRWTRDELILALDLYFFNPSSVPGKASKEVAELSGILNKLGLLLGTDTSGDFRNANGVYMKMMNFRRFDPTFAAKGKVGLIRGNKDEAIVWKEFANDRQRLKQVASAIRNAVKQGSLPSLHAFDDGDDDAVEGRLLTRMHKLRERNRKLVNRIKAKTLQQHGRLGRKLINEFEFSGVR